MSTRPVETLVIEPQSGWRFLDWRELRQYRDLFYFLVWRDIKIRYKQTVLGFAWAILQPFLSMVVFSVVFGKMAKVPSDGIPYPIFSYAALLPWTYFSHALSQSSQSLLSDASLLTKVYFPRVIIPVTPVLAKLMDFFVSFVILFLMMIYYGIVPGPGVLLLPFLVLVLVMASVGAGMWLTSFTIQYRDIKFVLPFLVQLLMFAAPVVWPASLVPGGYRLLYGLYPMAGIVEGFRAALLNQPLPWDLLAMSSLSSILLLLSALFYFRRMERYFADLA